MNRSRGLAPLLAIGVALSGGVLLLRAQSGSYDVIIRGGRIVDGTGNPWFSGDVAVRNGRIAAVGRLPNATASRIIDATGLVVAPGFIDLHTHSDMPLLADGTAQSKVRQGVTLDVLGESTSVAPRDGMKADDGATAVQPGLDHLHRLLRARSKRKGISMNVISHVVGGAGAPRRHGLRLASRRRRPSSSR